MIKNVVFDIGEVLLEYRWQELFMESGLDLEYIDDAGKKMFSPEIWTEFFDRGVKTIDEIREMFRESCPEYYGSICYLLDNPDKMHVARPDVWERVRLLKEKEYGIYLLSNYPKELFKVHAESADFMKYVDGRIVSYEVHLLKPEKDIYNALLDKYNLKSEECIFFDDRKPNVDVAKELGFSAVQVVSREMLVDYIDKNLLNLPV